MNTSWKINWAFLKGYKVAGCLTIGVLLILAAVEGMKEFNAAHREERIAEAEEAHLKGVRDDEEVL